MAAGRSSSTRAARPVPDDGSAAPSRDRGSRSRSRGPSAGRARSDRRLRGGCDGQRTAAAGRGSCGPRPGIAKSSHNPHLPGVRRPDSRSGSPRVFAGFPPLRPEASSISTTWGCFPRIVDAVSAGGSSPPSSRKLGHSATARSRSKCRKTTTGRAACTSPPVSRRRCTQRVRGGALFFSKRL